MVQKSNHLIPVFKRGRLVWDKPQPDTGHPENRTPKKYRVLPSNVKKIKVLLGKNKSVRFIAFELSLPRSSVQDLIKKYDLRCSSLRVSGVSECPRKCPSLKSSRLSGKTEFELHNYQVSIEIKSKPLGWNPNKILTFRKKNFDVINRKGWEEYYFNFNDASIHITPHKVLIFPPKIQGKVSGLDCKVMASQFVIDLIPKIENFLELKLSAGRITWFDISRQHMVMKNDKIFDSMKRLGFDKIKDEAGKVRLMLDESGGEKHIESLHPEESEEDIDRVHKLFDLNIKYGALNPKKTKDNILKNAENNVKLLNMINELKEEVKDNKKVKPVIDDREGVDYFG